MRFRPDLSASPLNQDINLCVEANTLMAMAIHQFESLNHEDIEVIKQRIFDSYTTRCETYELVNPSLNIHAIYDIVWSISEHARITTTRLTLRSHTLNIETGCWARTPRDQRIWQCHNGMQDESHILLSCDYTQHIRESVTHMCFDPLHIFMSLNSPRDSSKVCQQVLRVYS